MYGEIFTGVTLVATTGSGLPSLAPRGFTVPAEFSAVCPHPNLAAGAVYVVLKTRASGHPILIDLSEPGN